MKKKGFVLCGVIFCTVLLSLAACSAEDTGVDSEQDTEQTASKTNELYDKYLSVQEVTVYETTFAVVEKNPDGTFGEISGGDILYQTNEKEDIARIISMFDGWDMEANKVDEEYILDQGCTILIRFGDNLTLGYGTHLVGEEGIEPNEIDYGKYYGTVEGVPYYLPDEFGAFVDELEES